METRFAYSMRLSLFLFLGLSLVGSIQAQECSCPQFEIVSELEMVKAGDTVEFEIASTDATVLDATFAWTTSAGKIVSGQGSRKITVQTTAEMLSAPRPTPTPPPPAGPDGYFISMGIGRGRRPGFTVTASVDERNCPCRAMSAVMAIGREKREKNKAANVEDLALSSNKLTLPCEPGSNPREGMQVSPSLVIDVGVRALDTENDVLTYNYMVSGGKIIGSGANVKWDLSTVYPGTYMITAGVDDGCDICGKTQTKTLTVTACEPSCGLIECPTIEIAGPSDSLSVGENSFTANVSGGAQPSVTYEWIVNNGEIVSGQNSPSLVVRFTEKAVSLPTSITLRIGGVDPRGGCPVEQELMFENRRRKP
ncbi:MAG: hypothetical protein ABL984_15695 [Pyrinomonadaceae bacterium]